MKPWLLLFLLLSSLTSFGQLSGTFTIGGTTPDYANFSTAVSALHLQGVNGPVVFNVRNGTYVNKLIFTSWAGMSSSNPVTFQSENGDSSAVILQFSGGTNSDIPITMTGTGFITFKEITVKSSPSGIFRRCAHITNGLAGITFQNCLITGSATSNTIDENLVTTVNGLGTTFDSCRFENGYRAISITDNSTGPRNNHTIVSNCVFNNFRNGGIQGANIGNVTIAGNYFLNYFNAGAESISFNNINGIGLITKNFIEMEANNFGGSYARAISATQAAFASGSFISNNMIRITGGNSANRGIFFGWIAGGGTYQSINVDIVYNTIKIKPAVGIFCPAITGAYVGTRILNNILVSETSTSILNACDNADAIENNILYSEENVDWTQSISYLGPNNISANPLFVSASDLHIVPTSTSDNALPLSTVLTDFDGDLRDPISPDIGADEIPSFALDLETTGFIEPHPSQLFCNVDSIRVMLTNVGTDTITSATLSLSVNGTLANNVNWTGILAHGESDTVSLGNYPFLPSTIYDLKIFSSNPNGGIDESPLSDTVAFYNFNLAIGGTYTLGGVTPDFTSFQHLQSVLENSGLCAPVTINVRNGSYNDFFHLQNIQGLSSVNTLTIQGESGDSSLVEFWEGYPSAGNFTLFLEDVAYIKFKDIRIRNNGSINNRVIKLLNVHDITFESVIVQGYYCNGCSSQTQYGINAEVDSNLILDKVRAQVSGQPLLLFGNDNLGSASRNFSITNSTIGNFYIYDCHDIYMKNNTIGGGFNKFENCGRFEIEQNHFPSAIAFFSCSSAGAPSYFRNNTIFAWDQSWSPTWDYGLYIYGAGGIDFYHNTIKSKGYTRSVYIFGNQLNFHNNIYSQEDAVISPIVKSVSSTQIVSNNNLFWVPNNALSPSSLGYIQNFYGLDLNSFEANPQFSTQANSTFWPTNPIVDNLGLTSWSVTQDLYGTPRTPYGDLGAIEQLFPPAVNWINDSDICIGESVGVVNLGYSYLWNTGDTTAQLIPDTSGIYILSVTNNLGTATETLSITVYTPPTVSFMDSVMLCFADSITLEVNQPNLIYDWSNGSTDSTAVFSGAQVASVIVTNLGGCSDTASTLIFEYPEIQSNILVLNDETCFGDENGQLELEISSVLEPFTFNWSNTIETDTILDSLPSGDYFIMLTDANGCVKYDSATIQPGMAYPVISLSDSVYVCFGDSTTLQINQPGLTFDWSNGGVNSSAIFSGTQTASVIVTNSAGCQDSATIEILEHPEVQIDLLQTGETCAGDNDGSLELAVITVGSAYSFTWSHTTSSDSVLQNQIPGDYYVTLTDAYGCSVEDSATIQPGIVFNSNITLPPIICQFDTIQVLGNSPGTSHDWFINGNFNTNSMNLDYIANVNGSFAITLAATDGICSDTSYANLFVGTTTTGTAVISSCDTYTWIDGNTYTSSNNSATYTLSNAVGCDSVVTLDLTILSASYAVDLITSCDNYTWIDGNTYNSSNNTATYTLMNSAGCDSIVTLDLTILMATSATDTITACDNYTWIDGNTYTSSNNSATHVLTNSLGCDSIVTLDLTINQVNTSITNNDPTLEAISGLANYQWLDCNNNFAPISGETTSTFTATQNGLYAVQVDDEGCSDTSDCFIIEQVSLNNLYSQNWSIYPNPTRDNITISFHENLEFVRVEVSNVLGQIISKNSFSNVNDIVLALGVNPGLYFVKITNGNQELTSPIIQL